MKNYGETNEIMMEKGLLEPHSNPTSIDRFLQVSQAHRPKIEEKG